MTDEKLDSLMNMVMLAVGLQEDLSKSLGPLTPVFIKIPKLHGGYTKGDPYLTITEVHNVREGDDYVVPFCVVVIGESAVKVYADTASGVLDPPIRVMELADPNSFTIENVLAAIEQARSGKNWLKYPRRRVLRDELAKEQECIALRRDSGI